MPDLFLQLPLLVIGGVMATYWYRVLRMAIKQRRQTGRAANLIPAERLGRALRAVWTPIIFIWIAHPILSGLTQPAPLLLRPLLPTSVVRWPLALLVILGYLVTRRCWKRMGRAWRMGIDPAERNPLVVDGLFAYVRHPIYALSAGMMFATALALPSPIMLCAAGLHILLLGWEAAREERHLVAIHGQAYYAYQQAVGRIVPRSFRAFRTPIV